MAATTVFQIEMRAASEQLRQDLDKGKRLVISSANDMAASFARIGEVAGGFALAQVGIAGLRDAFDIAKRAAIDYNVALQDSQRSFAFLGAGADDARTHIEQLMAVAEETPFPTEAFYDASRTLRGLGVDAAIIPGLLTKIADAATVAKTSMGDATQAIGRFIANVASGGNAAFAIRGLFAQGLVKAETVAQIRALDAAGASADKVINTLVASFDKFRGAAAQAAQEGAGLGVRIKDALAELSGTSFQPLFVLLEHLGQSFLGALRTEEAHERMREFGISVGNEIVKIAAFLSEMWEPLRGVEKLLNANLEAQNAFADKMRGIYQPLIDKLKEYWFWLDATRRKAEEWGTGKKIEPPEMPTGPPSPTPAQLLRSSWEQTVADIRAQPILKPIKPPPMPTAPDWGGTGNLAKLTAQANALEQARQIVAELDTSLTAAQKSSLQMEQRFEKLAQVGGAAAVEIRRLGEQAKGLVLLASGLEVLNESAEFLRTSLPVYDEEANAIENIIHWYDLRVKKAPELAEALRTEQAELLRQREAYKDYSANVRLAVEAATDFELITQNVTAILAPARATVDQFVEGIRRFPAEVAGMQEATRLLSGAGVVGPSGGEQLQGMLEMQIRTATMTKAWAEQNIRGLTEGSDGWRIYKRAIDEANASLAENTVRLRGLPQANAMATLVKDIDLARRQFLVFGGDYDVLAAKISATVKAINELLLQGKNANDAQVMALKESLTHLENTKRVADFVTSSVEMGMTRAADTMVDAFFRGELAAVKWGDVVLDILADIVKEMIRVFVIQAAVRAIGGLVGGFSGVGGPMPTQAMAGGIVTGPTFLLAGEGGNAEAIIPLDRLSSMVPGGSGRGGGAVTVNIFPPKDTETKTEQRADSKGNKNIDIYITSTVKKGLSGGVFDRDLAGAFGLSRQGTRR